jgi:mRNA (guanine-N7-)-methyltransferase
MNTKEKNFSDVSSKYNKTEGRKEDTKIQGIRNFNNWIKSSLITLLCPNNANVLDICGGRGGDLYKYKFKNINNYVLFDNADVSVMEANKRISEMDKKVKPKNYIVKVADCFVDNIIQEIPENLFFDFASCQFAFHYACGNIEHIKRLFKNVSERLKKGSYFVGTTVNEHQLIDKLKASDNMEFGNDKYNIRFDVEEKANFKRIGTKYYFTLTESVPNIPEYIVHFNSINKIAKQYGLKLIYKKTFEECKNSKFSFINTENSRNMEIVKRNYEKIEDIPKDQWEVCSLYLIFVYVKL